MPIACAVPVPGTGALPAPRFERLQRHLILLRTPVASVAVLVQGFATRCFCTCRLLIGNQIGFELETTAWRSVSGY